MSQTFVTQCPHCQTRFRVSREQLAIAHGSVRCGACLQVFDAASLLADQLKAAAPEPQIALQPVQPLHLKELHAPLKLEKPPAALPQDDEPVWIHDDLDMGELDEEMARLEHQEQLFNKHSSTGSKPHTQALHPRTDDTDDDEVHPDEAWAIALLREEMGPDAESAPKAPAQKTDLPRPVLHTHAADTRQEPVIELPPPVIDDEKNDDQPALGQPLDTPRDTDDVFDDETAAPRSSRRHKRAQELDDLIDEPLQLDWRKPRRPWRRRAGWIGLNVLALLILAGQYVWYHFDELARQDQYRPWFAAICPEVGCRLPSRVDIDQIRSSNLVVRSHPEFSGALIVDAILYNRATFGQPFPLLELRFADLNGRLIASRRFKPAEYLAGELAGGREMPPQTPIHISLDILDPGARAVNYSLNFISPE
ncbi:DUF3426 domain-containing protein [Pseudomonas matsuisoli]|uniref:Zinc finger/thioredoxin putative domain-containing protein n=1 Tax=Pseudomonas matsuisoli TaxID=1515666 RepID=A0A917PXN6_9PSED|nr:DUF3426 domain-containing protein [Pseudomonas matsuisoli]GGJ97852.1 hypothetical protein GCM10009304_24640 [Pseudomonas matsuisoli]